MREKQKLDRRPHCWESYLLKGTLRNIGHCTTGPQQRWLMVLDKVRAELFRAVGPETCLSEAHSLSFLVANCPGERKLQSSRKGQVMIVITARTHIYVYRSGLFSICFSERKVKYRTVWFKTRHMKTVNTKTSPAARHWAICVHMYCVFYFLLNTCYGSMSELFNSYGIDEEIRALRG